MTKRRRKFGFGCCIGKADTCWYKTRILFRDMDLCITVTSLKEMLFPHVQHWSLHLFDFNSPERCKLLRHK
jgi:hypothetical protein